MAGEEGHSHKLSLWADLANRRDNKHEEPPDQLCPLGVFQSAAHGSSGASVRVARGPVSPTRDGRPEQGRSHPDARSPSKVPSCELLLQKTCCTCPHQKK